MERADEQGRSFRRCAPASPAAWRSAATATGTGRPVNLASRVTGVARPGSVLATEEVRDAAGGDRYAWSRAGRWELKGFRERVPLYRVRPGATEA